MHLKESAYNFIYDDLGKDQIVFYNSRTGALAVVHEDQYKQYKGFQEKGKEIEDAEFLKNLLKCGYLLPAEVDEKFLIKTNMMQGRYNKNLLSLTIAPTMACNFRCIYCFEKGHSLLESLSLVLSNGREISPNSLFWADFSHFFQVGSNPHEA